MEKARISLWATVVCFSHDLVIRDLNPKAHLVIAEFEDRFNQEYIALTG